MSSNPNEASDFFLGFLCKCLSYFTTEKITFTSSNHFINDKRYGAFHKLSDQVQNLQEEEEKKRRRRETVKWLGASGAQGVIRIARRVLLLSFLPTIPSTARLKGFFTSVLFFLGAWVRGCLAVTIQWARFDICPKCTRASRTEMCFIVWQITLHFASA